MSYVKADGELRLVRGSRGPRSPFGSSSFCDDEAFRLANPGVCSVVQKSAALAKADAKAAEAEIARLALDPSIGPVLADALKGASSAASVTKIASRAKELAASFGSNDMQKAAYKMFYSQARAGMEVLDDALSSYPLVGEIRAGIEGAVGVYGEVKALYQGMANGTVSDAAGIAQTASIVERGMKQLSSFVGMMSSSGAAKTAQQAIDFVGLGAGCAASIAGGAGVGGAWGAAGGALACAGSVLMSVLSSFLNRGQQGPDACDLGCYQFVPHQKQLPLIAADANRLAALLRYRYGLKSYASLFGSAYNRVVSGNEAPDVYAECCWGPLHRSKYPKADGSLPLPAYGATGAIALLAAGIADGILPQASSAALVAPRGAAFDPVEAAFQWEFLLNGIGDYQTCPHRLSSCDMDEYYHWQVGTVSTSNRWQIPTLYQILDYAKTMNVAVSIGKSVAVTPSPFQAATMLYAELVTFFAAVTRREFQIQPMMIKPWAMYELPVRAFSAGFSPVQWEGYEKIATITNVVSGVSVGNETSALQLGHLRLLAALSYIHMLWAWEGQMTSLGSGVDVVSDVLPYKGSDPAAILRVPVDPRAAIYGGKLPTVAQVHAAINSNDYALKTIATKAAAQAAADHQIVRAEAIMLRNKILASGLTTSSLLSQMAALKSPTSAINPAFLTGQCPGPMCNLKLQACSTDAICPAGTKCINHNCLNPDGTIPSYATQEPAWKNIVAPPPGGGGVSSGGGGGVLVLGGLGLLALMLLR